MKVLPITDAQADLAIKEVKFAHSHSLDAMATTILQQQRCNINLETDYAEARQQLADFRRLNNDFAEQRDNAEAQRKVQAEVIAQQEREIENYANRMKEMKDLLAALQSNFTLKVERLQESETDRANMAIKHAEYVTATHEEMEVMRKAIRGMSAKVRYMSQLVAENTELSIRQGDKYVFRKTRTPITDKLRNFFARKEAAVE